MSVLFAEICGGITSPKGFVAGSAFCGIKKGNKKKHDMALIYSREESTVAAATFTTNKVKAAPVRVSVEHMRNPHVRAIVVNSGNANACTGLTGIEHAKRMAVAAGKALQLKERQVLVCSTGRIGVEMPIKKMEHTIKKLPKALQSDGSLKAAKAIMTSDTFAKEVAVELVIDDKTVRIGGIAKGAGMIDPNMATMLCFITTDAAIGKKELQHALSIAVEQSFNRITVDGDMSTNDTVIALANGLAENRPLKTGQANSQIFQNALNYVTLQLARMIVEDGEGVTKFVEVHVQGAATYNDARKAAEAVAKSTLVKCAWFGCDPNWGRIMDALGYCSIKLREEMVDIFYDGVIAVKNGMASKTPFSKLQDVVAKEKFTITIDMHLGSVEYIVYTTDLSTRYVELNMGNKERSMSQETHLARAEALIEALPYIQKYRGKTVVIKYGGSAMEDEHIVERMLRDVVFLEAVGINPVLIHGGGKTITLKMRDAGLKAQFVNGLRVTNEQAIRIVEDVLDLEINPKIVSTLNELGGKAVGISGKKVIKADKLPPQSEGKNVSIDLGFVGEANGLNLTEIQRVLADEKTPVISPIGQDENGVTLNVNADIAAGAIAGALKASKLIYLSDVLGIMRDPREKDSLIPSVTSEMIETLIEDEVIEGGMIPKVRSAVEALAEGVGKVHFIDGRIPHSLLLEIFTNSGVGTEIVK